MKKSSQIGIIVVVLFASYFLFSHKSSPTLSTNILLNDLPNGDTSSAECRVLIDKENIHANAVYTPDGPAKFVETITDWKYIYTKHLCLGNLERIFIDPLTKQETFDFFITDLATNDCCISELSHPVDLSKTEMWYFRNKTTDVSKSPSVIWKEIRKLQ